LDVKWISNKQINKDFRGSDIEDELIIFGILFTSNDGKNTIFLNSTHLHTRYVPNVLFHEMCHRIGMLFTKGMNDIIDMLIERIWHYVNIGIGMCDL
jgi:hypothetical protein